MNPAGLKVHLEDLKENGILIINTDNFTKKNLGLAKWETALQTDDVLSDLGQWLCNDGGVRWLTQSEFEHHTGGLVLWSYIEGNLTLASNVLAWWRGGRGERRSPKRRSGAR